MEWLFPFEGPACYREGHTPGGWTLSAEEKKRAPTIEDLRRLILFKLATHLIEDNIRTKSRIAT